MRVFRYFIIVFVVLLAVSAYSPAAFADSPGYTTTTCGGNATIIGAQNFFFGIIWANGDCSVQPFYANSFSEAFDCAKLYCLNCDIEDITNLVQGSRVYTQDGPPTPGIGSYCPAK